jgi:hypothetical protein
MVNKIGLNRASARRRGSYKFHIAHRRKNAMKRCRFEQPLSPASVKLDHALNRKEGNQKINRPTFWDMSTINQLWLKPLRYRKDLRVWIRDLRIPTLLPSNPNFPPEKAFPFPAFQHNPPNRPLKSVKTTDIYIFSYLYSLFCPSRFSSAPSFNPITERSPNPWSINSSWPATEELGVLGVHGCLGRG